MTGTTVVRNLGWAVVWDAARDRQAYARGIDLAFERDRILHVGPGWDGAAEREIDGRGLFALPGFVDIHAHPTLEPMHRGLTEDVGSEKLYGSSLYEFNTAFRPDAEGMVAAARLASLELLQSGVTTLVDISAGVQRAASDAMIQAGLRLVVAPGFRCARWSSPDGHTVAYDWDLEGGRKTYEAALAYVHEMDGQAEGRVTGMLAPMQIDTVSPDILKESHAQARAGGLKWQVHAGQSIPEVLEIARRHGLTPIQWMAELGVLDETTIIGHAIFLDHHSTSNWPTRQDLDLIAQSGASVAHCPTIFGRRGYTLEHFGRYVDAGIPVGLGTDSYPHNILEEARHAACYGRIAAGWVHALRTSDILDAITVRAAQVIGRDDIGRLAPGCRADLVLADLSHPAMQPVRDPIKSLVFSAADRAVRDVFVAGRHVVADGRVVTIDPAEAGRAVTEAQQRAIRRTPTLDRLGRDADTLVPMTLPEAT